MLDKDMQEVDIDGLRFFPQETPGNQEVQDKIVKLWNSRRSFIILSGPPGVGKTRASEDFIIKLLNHYNASHSKDDCRITNLFKNFKNKVYSEDEIELILKNRDIKFIWDICVLHPQYSYEDLIRGYLLDASSESSLPKLEVREGLLGFTARAVSVIEKMHPNSDYPLGLVILDEINRAPIGQLFGEGLYALDRRGEAVTTPYRLENVGNNLIVPSSLLILGTMNSVDRAVSGFDFALRRRFVTITMKPNQMPIEERLQSFKVARSIAIELFKKIRRLVINSSQLGTVPSSELVVGHSYFLPPEVIKNDDEAIEWLVESYQYQILPTLVDYQEQGLIEFSEKELIGIPGASILRGEQSLGDLKADDIDIFLRRLNTES